MTFKTPSLAQHRGSISCISGALANFAFENNQLVTIVTRDGLRQISTTPLHCPIPKTPRLIQTSSIFKDAIVIAVRNFLSFSFLFVSSSRLQVLTVDRFSRSIHQNARFRVRIHAFVMVLGIHFHISPFLTQNLKKNCITACKEISKNHKEGILKIIDMVKTVTILFKVRL